MFLGCSLDKDETLEVLGELHREVPGVTHYAVLAAKYSIAGLRKRRDELGRYGITPLWFVPGEFESIERILEGLLHEASTRLIFKTPKPATWPARPDPMAQATPVAAPAVSSLGEQGARLTRRLAPRLARGEVAFFLGAGIHLGVLPSARDFYAALSKEYGFSEEDAQRAEIAQYLIDHEGKRQAWAAARHKLTTANTMPSILASMP